MRSCCMCGRAPGVQRTGWVVQMLRKVGAVCVFACLSAASAPAGAPELPEIMTRPGNTVPACVTPGRMIEVAHALEFIELGHRDDVYHTLRAMIVTHPREFPLFDEAFRSFWRRPATEWTTLDLRSLG